MIAATSVGPEIPAEEHDLEHEDRERARLAHMPDAATTLHEARLTGAVASCITVSSDACSAAISPCTVPSRITTMRCASARISGRSLDTTTHAAPAAAFARTIS